ncbi:DMT family transporter [Marimonas sp. MJW-29]|uniref:DMT family transporter n=1 Tax=Sulfitobacter sediminis TaxID=3234186 RepID=A0ABV3RSH6_9RHOB
MSLIWPMLVVGAIGFTLSQQPVINAATAQTLNSPFAAAAFSLTISAVVVFAIFLATGAPTRPAQVLDLPWWSILAGVIGAAFVAGGAMLLPLTGAALFFVCLVAGQLLGAVFADLVGTFGLEPRGLSFQKIAGVLLAFVGAALVRWG